jgi:hypothetical protein
LIGDVASTPAVFGLWSSQPSPEDADLSYDLGPGVVEAPPVWRLELPPDQVGAASQLADWKALLISSQEALDEVPERLDRLEMGRGSAGGISFGQPVIGDLPDPESDLIILIQALHQPLLGVSFGTGDEQRGKLEEAFQRFKDDMERLLHLVTQFAWVETEQGGVLLGRTVVGWSGDADTAWRNGLKAEAYRLHIQSLAQALASRGIILHALVVTVQSAAKLAVYLATPGGALLALPLAWKFVNQVLADVEKYHKTQLSIGRH